MMIWFAILMVISVLLYLACGILVAAWGASFSDEAPSRFAFACWVIGWPFAFLWGLFKWK